MSELMKHSMFSVDVSDQLYSKYSQIMETAEHFQMCAGFVDVDEEEYIYNSTDQAYIYEISIFNQTREELNEKFTEYEHIGIMKDYDGERAYVVSFNGVDSIVKLFKDMGFYPPLELLEHVSDKSLLDDINLNDYKKEFEKNVESRLLRVAKFLKENNQIDDNIENIAIKKTDKELIEDITITEENLHNRFLDDYETVVPDNIELNDLIELFNLEDYKDTIEKNNVTAQMILDVDSDLYEIETEWGGDLGSVVEGSKDGLMPMMNYLRLLNGNVTNEDKLNFAKNQACETLVYDNKNDSYMMGLSGGGMDLSWDLVMGYIKLGYIPPIDLMTDLPEFASGNNKTKEENKKIIEVLSELKGSIFSQIKKIEKKLENNTENSL